MTNEVFKDYIERKKAEVELLSMYDQEEIGCSVVLNEWMDVDNMKILSDFLSDMAQEIFDALPEEATMDKEERELNDLVHTTERQYDINLGHNFCRSTFLENIKKLK